MNKRLKYILRWVTVLPGAILIALLTTLPLHWVLYFTLAKGETISGINIEPIEGFLLPFIMSLVLIISGFKLAPDNKFKTAIVLFGVYIFFWIFVNLISSPNDRFSLRSIVAVLGLIIGLVSVKLFEKKEIRKKTSTN